MAYTSWFFREFPPRAIFWPLQSAQLFPQSRSTCLSRPTLGLTTSHPLSAHPGGLAIVLHHFIRVREHRRANPARRLCQVRKYKGAPFKVPTLNLCIVAVGPQHLEDIKKSTDDEFSVIEAANDSAKVDYLIGPGINSNPYHISVAQIHLTRNLGLYHPDSKHDVHAAFEEMLDLKDNGTVNGLSSFVTDIDASDNVETIREIVCRASNRVFVGLPLCRDHDWIDLNSQFAVDVATDASILNMFPKFLLPNTARGIARAMKHLDPIVKERLKFAGEHEDDWSDNPNDILQWLIDEKQESSTRQATADPARVNYQLLDSCASFPQSTTNMFWQTFTQALYNLPAYPRYVGPLREEVDAIIRERGWTKEAIASMRKVDSFLAETQRLKGVLTCRCLAARRYREGDIPCPSFSQHAKKAMKDPTLSDRTFVPKGTHLCVPTYVVHRDGAVYDNPGVFNPFRFSRLCDDGDASARHQMAGVTQDHFPFGFGKHVWYGCTHL
ncbi:cytochrome P450 [Pisolithus albus]|nr:cytochrome P450 [Pisolithus albus]